MHISSTNSNSSLRFTSRNKMLKDLGDISMLVKREFPVTSNTFIELGRKQTAGSAKLYRYSSGLVDEIRGFSKQNNGDNLILYLIKILDSMKSFRVGNCSELSNASLLACKMNGYKDVKKMFLYAYDKGTQKIRNLDHTVVAINFNKPSKLKAKNYADEIYARDNKAIIMDTWLGKTDYERNITSEYVNDKFKKRLHPNETLCYIPFNSDALSKKDIIYLEHQYPGLLKKKKPGIIHRLIYKLMSKEKYEYEPIGQSLKESYRKNYDLANAISDEELQNLIKFEMAKNNLKTKSKKNFFQRFMEEVNEVNEKLEQEL